MVNEARRLEVEDSHDIEYERLLGAVNVYEGAVTEYIDGSGGWDEVKSCRSIVELCAMRLRGGI